MKTVANGFVIVLLMWASAASAASPRLARINPRGGQHGTEMSIFFEGARLGDTREVLFYDAAELAGMAVTELKALNDNKVEAKDYPRRLLPAW